MLKTIKVDKVFINDKKKDGSPFVTKKGDPFKMVVLKWDTESASHLAFDETDQALQIKEGSTVEVELTQNGQYQNFDLPKSTKELEDRAKFLTERITKDKTELDSIQSNILQRGAAKAPVSAGQAADLLGGEIVPEDVPF